jgi:hypothetical protein
MTADDASDDGTTGEDGTAGDETDRPAGADELAAALEAAYGDRFDDDRREELRERVADVREAGETLSESDLSNGDEPAFAFRAYRGEE